MDCYVFTAEPAGDTYHALIDCCCTLSSGLLLMVRDPDIAVRPPLETNMKALREFLIESRRGREWPGTVLLGHDAMLYWHRVTARLQDCAKTLTSHLFGWLHPHLPEDPCFLRSSGEPCLVTTSHERDAYLLLTESERDAVQRAQPALSKLLRRE
jgi:hypothetical protein